MIKTELVNMTKRILLAVMILTSLIASSLAVSKTAYAFAGGDGSEGNPFQITTCNQLNDMSSSETNANKSYVLNNSIDCTGISYQSIKFGEGGDAFSGILEGNNYTISNLTINQPIDYSVGLFGALNGATITNLKIDGAVINGDGTVGALAGHISNNTYIENVHIANSEVTGVSSNVGGLAGHTENSHISKLTVDAEVEGGESSSIGGLTGSFYTGTIEEAGSYGSVSGGQYVGGLVGQSGESDYFWVHSTANVTLAGSSPFTESVGGLIGYTYEDTIASAYATGDVSGVKTVGGLVGALTENSQISYSYSANDVNLTGVGPSGGLVARVQYGGQSDDTTFWDTELSGHNTSFGGGEIGKTTAEMKTKSTFLAAGWDFDDVPIWGLVEDHNNGYPCHSWEAGCISEGSGGSDNETPELPNSNDNNADGIDDADQPNVTTVLSPVSTKYVTVEVDDDCELSDVSVANASVHISKDIAYEYQSGFVNFTASGCGSDEITVKLYYHGIDKDNFTVRKYNSNTGVYFTISSANLSVLESPLLGTLVTYNIVDNGDLDLDPADGVIVDPVGLGMNIVSSPNTGLENVADYIFVKK